MNIGIISDIHGDLDGLERALTLLREEGVAQIICAGDLVGRGKQQNEVAARIKAQNIPCVRGNHDHNAVLRGLPLDVEEDERKSALTEETLAYLEMLAMTLKFLWEGITVLLAHGTPWSQDTYLLPESLPKTFKRVADEAKTELVVLGHTHEPMVADVRGTCLIVNPGAIYRHHNEGNRQRTCGLLSLPAMDFTVFDVDTGGQVRPAYVRVRLSDR